MLIESTSVNVIRMLIKYIFVLVLFFVYIVHDVSLGFSETSAWWTHFTFAFQHGGWLHLIINSLVFVNSFGVLEKHIKWYVLLPVIYLVSVISSFFFIPILPTVGSSGMIYAMFGIMLAIVVKNNARKEQKLMFCASLALMLIVSCFTKSSNFFVHIISFVLGFLFWFIRTYYLRSSSF